MEEGSSIPWCYKPLQLIVTTIPTTIQITIPTTIQTTIPTTIPTTISTTLFLYSSDCEEKCLKCNEESKKLNLCISCNEDKNYKRLNYDNLLEQTYHECILKTSPKLKRFYFNATTNEFRPCYETCATCEKEGNSKYHNCLT